MHAHGSLRYPRLCSMPSTNLPFLLPTPVQARPILLSNSRPCQICRIDVLQDPTARPLRILALPLALSAQLVVVLNSSSRCSLVTVHRKVQPSARGQRTGLIPPVPVSFTRYNSPIGVLYARRLAIPWRRESGSLARRVPITRVLSVSGSNSISALFLEVCPGQHSCRCHAYWPCDRPSIEFNHVCCDSQWVSPRNTHRYSIG